MIQNGRNPKLHNNTNIVMISPWVLCGLMRSRVHSLWLLVDQCVLRNWNRILVRAVKGLISRAGMVSICPLLWQRDVKLQQTNHGYYTCRLKLNGYALWILAAKVLWSCRYSLWQTNDNTHKTMTYMYWSWLTYIFIQNAKWLIIKKKWTWIAYLTRMVGLIWGK